MLLEQRLLLLSDEEQDVTMSKTIPLSVLDLIPISAGSGSSEALRNSLELAQHAESVGYSRYWLAEHHNSDMLASAVPEIMIGQIAAVTQKMRVGAGGIMLPNHAPLKVAESFKLLEALFPGRIDLGLGRAPGTDQLTVLALRRSRAALAADDFPDQLDELLAFLTSRAKHGEPLARIEAMPNDVAFSDVWLLGTSTFSAQLAAQLGLSFAFAHHIHPEPAIEAMTLYRREFQPVAGMAKPRALLSVSAICAEFEYEAEEVASSSELSFVRFARQGGRTGPIPSPAEARAYPYTESDRQIVETVRQRVFIGTPENLKRRIGPLIEATQADELMISGLIYDPEARRTSYRLLAEAFGIRGN